MLKVNITKRKRKWGEKGKNKIMEHRDQIKCFKYKINFQMAIFYANQVVELLFVVASIYYNTQTHYTQRF